jgi:hypothetical protein
VDRWAARCDCRSRGRTSKTCSRVRRAPSRDQRARAARRRAVVRCRLHHGLGSRARQRRPGLSD